MIYGVHSPAPGDGPGKRLRLAREAANLSCLDVAKQLRLHLNLILALEDDDYHKIPGPTFIRGYLRAYARILHIPEQSIMESFDSLSLTNKEHAKSSEASKRDISLVQWGYGLSVIFLMLGLAIFYLAQFNSHPKPRVLSHSIAIPPVAEQPSKPLDNNKPWLMPEIQAIIQSTS